MATKVITNAHLTLNSVDLSSSVRSITLDYSADTGEDTAMGDSNRTYLGGLTDWTVTVEANHDDAAGVISATLFSIVGSTVAVVVGTDGGTAAATTPTYTGNVIVTDFSPLSAGVGDVGTNTFSLQGTGTLTRNTS